jgi:predicted ATPase
MASPLAPVLVGRAALIDRLARETVAGGLQRLTGPGGVGKTSVARQLAGRLAASHAFVDGVCWVDLAPLSDGALVPQVVAAALGVVEPRGRSWTEALAEALRPAGTLLVHCRRQRHLGVSIESWPWRRSLKRRRA